MNSSFNESFDYGSVLFTLRSIFYLLKPSETYYKNAEDVPDLTAKASNIFFSFIFFEQILFLIKKGRFNGKINDGVASISAGIISVFPNFLFRDISLTSYSWCFENIRLFDLPYDNVWTYVFALLFIDMGYYWFHRSAHEINVFWAAHQTHHSSQEYNLTSALRQSIFQGYTSWIFYLPLAVLGLPPSIFIVHSHLNLIYQFWIHTEVVNNIGPLEYILNTPSHHRVHHGRNPYCIDKNYAGVLIIWDRMFGTFEAERKNVEIAYGLVHPIETFNPIYIQVFNYQYIFKRVLESKSWSERFSVLFKGPGWVKGSPRLGHPGDIPEVESPIRKHNVQLSALLNFYVIVHFIFVLIPFSVISQDINKYSTLVLTFIVLLTLYNLTCFGFIFDAKPYAYIFESIRCMLFIICDHFYGSHFNYLLHGSKYFYLSFKWFNIISFIATFYISLHKLSSAKSSLESKKSPDQIKTKSS